MEYEIIKEADRSLGYVKEISDMADKNRASFGFLSASAYEQMASKGQLWVVVNDINRVVGYLMFGGTMPTLKVFQVYICDSIRGEGIGKNLIDELKSYAGNMNYHSIIARVASDLPANKFWGKVGFSVYKQEKGGETTKRTINVRGYRLHDNDLFGDSVAGGSGIRPTGPVLEKPIYALDLNLLLDIVESRPGSEKVVKLMQEGFQGKFSICVTPEFKKELARESEKFLNDPVMKLAYAFPELESGSEAYKIASSLGEIVFPSRSLNRRGAVNDASDLMHLAHCISAGVAGFVTREKALLRACESIREMHGVAIVSPEEIVLDDGDWLDFSNPASAGFVPSCASVSREIVRFVEDFIPPKNIMDLLSVNALNFNDLSVYEARYDGRLFGVYFSQKPQKTTGRALAALYLDESNPKSIAAIDHFLEIAIRHKSGFSYRIDLYVGKGQDVTQETLARKGFFDQGECFSKIIFNDFVSYKNWADFSRDVKLLCGFHVPKKLPSKKELINTGVCISDEENMVQEFSWFEFETLIGPRFILNHDRDCILVPIRENYASGLIGDVKNQLSLLSNHDQSLLLEKAYFRSPSRASIFKKGGVVAFYVSGGSSIQEIIGFARITYSDVVPIHEAIVRLDRQGVLSRDELIGVSDKRGMIHAFTFDNFLALDNRVSFSKAKKLGLISDANLVSPERIDFKQLRSLIGAAFYA